MSARAAVALLIGALAGCDGGATGPDAGSGADAGPSGSCFSVDGRTVAISEVATIGGVIYPDLTLDADDRPWLAFTQGTTSARWAAVARFDGSSWSAAEPVEQQAATYLGKRPSIAIDASGGLHVVAYDEDGCRPRYSTRSAGGSWTSTALYLEGVDAGDHSALAIDGAGTLHLTFLEYGTYRILYGRRAGGDWEFEPVGAGSGARAGSSSLAVDGTGQPHVAFYTGDPDQMLRYAVRAGGSWTVEDVDATADSGHYASIALDPTGAPVIAALKWPDDASEVRLASRGGDGWQVETVDDGLGITYTTGLVVLPCGATLVAYARNEGSGTPGLWLAHRNPGEADWTRTSLDASTYVSGIDLAVASDGQVHVVFLDETNFVLKHARW